jgi:voltage-dependent anion channel protein 2
MPAIPAYGAIGSAVGDLFKGSAKSGAFQLDNKVTYSGVTSSGLNVTLTGVAAGDKIAPTLKASYAQGNYASDLTYDGSSRVAVNASIANLLLPGLKLSTSCALPDTNSARASIDYAFPYLSTRATVSLTNQPVVDLLASTGYKDILVGVETGFDTAKSVVRGSSTRIARIPHAVPRNST